MPVLERSTQSAALARALGAFCLAAASLGTVVVAFLPLPPASDRSLMLVLSVAVGALGALLLAFARRLPPWTSQAALALGTVAISLDIAFSPHATVNDEMLYLLPACSALL